MSFIEAIDVMSSQSFDMVPVQDEQDGKVCGATRLLLFESLRIHMANFICLYHSHTHFDKQTTHTRARSKYMHTGIRRFD